MAASEGVHFSREELRGRYAVTKLEEDLWHRHSDRITAAVVGKYLEPWSRCSQNWVLNAGAGVTTIGTAREVSLDLFPDPVIGKQYPVCATVARLPFSAGQFSAVVCVGEVLAYCDPNVVIGEFARVLRPAGRLILDFGSTRSWRVFGTPSYGSSAALITSEYNGSAEKTWIYDPAYIKHVLERFGFKITAVHGAHRWSPLARRLGVGLKIALKIEELFSRCLRPARCADTITIVSDLRAIS